MFKFPLFIVYTSLMLISSSCYCQVPRSDRFSNLKFDTTKTAILDFKKWMTWVFDGTFKPARLIQEDLSVIDSFLVEAVDDFNSWQQIHKSGHPWKIDLKSHSYSKQLFAVTNKNGEKEVWVNCFCTADNLDWKSTLIYVEDGATCFFNFKINLTTKAYYEFRVNAAA